MMEKPHGSLFRTPKKSSVIIDLIKEKKEIKFISSANDFLINGVCDSRRGGENKFSFINKDQYENNHHYKKIKNSILLMDAVPEAHTWVSNQICVLDDPRAVFIETLNTLIQLEKNASPPQNDHQNLNISPYADISASAHIEADVHVGEGSVICAGVILKSGTKIGKNTIIRENTVVGSDGITIYRSQDNRLLKFPHVGGVVIGDNSEIGANSVVVKGILEPTWISDHVIIGNLCNIGHGVNIGSHSWISVGSLVGGHSIIEAQTTIAMGVRIRDNITIGTQAAIGMGSVVTKNVEPQHSVFGNPAKRFIGLKTGPER